MPSADRQELTIGYATPASPLAWPHPPEGPAELNPAARPAARTLVGGVGYTNLRDRSFGPLLVERLLARAWPPDVVVEDLSYGPIDVLFKLQAEGRPFRLGIFAGAVARGRAPGTVERYTWSSFTPAADDLQERIGEALTGVVSLDNLLYILDHFGALPERTVVIEVEPEPEEGWGAELSPPVAATFEVVERLILGTIDPSLPRVARE